MIDFSSMTRGIKVPLTPQVASQRIAERYIKGNNLSGSVKQVAQWIRENPDAYVADPSVSGMGAEFGVLYDALAAGVTDGSNAQGVGRSVVERGFTVAPRRTSANSGSSGAWKTPLIVGGVGVVSLVFLYLVTRRGR